MNKKKLIKTLSTILLTLTTLFGCNKLKKITINSNNGSNNCDIPIEDKWSLEAELTLGGEKEKENTIYFGRHYNIERLEKLFLEDERYNRTIPTYDENQMLEFHLIREDYGDNVSIYDHKEKIVYTEQGTLTDMFLNDTFFISSQGFNHESVVDKIKYDDLSYNSGKIIYSVSILSNNSEVISIFPIQGSEIHSSTSIEIYYEKSNNLINFKDYYDSKKMGPTRQY